MKHSEMEQKRRIYHNPNQKKQKNNSKNKKGVNMIKGGHSQEDQYLELRTILRANLVAVA